ncbi:TolA-binding protein [Sphingomonas sp. YR710]|uniref:tetratricopeptide repeat protein n=1 Tax=Sphingomonas sp. YR710 TaxID=1882773 RepID=UPI00088CC5EA|nr:tetratricopeptide repeat protein [Sphingomonas sp. YR710]SDC87769.1 TolA-binding protein [Sphingomonas sp. YR710]
MKKAIIAILFLSSVAGGPLLAADPVLPIEGRVGKLEKEMRAVQRKVFPGGAQQYFEPEIQPQAAPPAPVGMPASSPVADLSRRVDALERSLAQLTGQVEQSSYNLRKLEDQFAKMKGDAEFRLNALEGKPAPGAAPEASLPYVVPAAPKGTTGGASVPVPPKSAPPKAAPGKPAPVAAAPAPTDAAATPASADPGKDAYMVGYDLWTQKKYPEAIAALHAMAAKYPKHKYVSYARNLAGRAYLDNGQYKEAIRELFDNTKDEAGERAPQSYVYMAQALMKLKPPLPEKACQAYEVLQAKYPDKVTGPLAALVSQGKAEAKCQ